MSKCPNCGIELEDNLKFCGECGASLEGGAVRVHEQSFSSQEQMHEEEKLRMFQTMTVEQIVAAKPDLPPAVAKALMEKFAAETTANMEKYKAIMKDFLQMDREDCVTEAPTAERKCPNCGAVVDGDSAFCDECGASL